MKFLLLFLSVSLISADQKSIEEFTTANNLFTRSVYKEVTKVEGGNFLVSPFSAETVLAFTQSGCKGPTAEELRTALHLPNDENKIEEAVKTLLPKFKSNDYTFEIANKMYVKEKFSVKEEFKNIATSVYQAEIEPIDFAKNVDAVNTMNGWVEQHTNNKIKNLIQSEHVDQDTIAVLINALYFRGNWSNPFSLSSTGKRKFYKTLNETVEVDIMHKWGSTLNYYECPYLRAQFLELHFQSYGASLIVVLPNEKDGLGRIESNLEQVFATDHNLRYELLNVALPKFKIETRIDFTEILKNLGVHKIFGSEADVSGIAGKKGELYVSKVAQKAFIDVSENGVEAAAATYVVSYKTSAPPLLQQPKDFIADHPFIFYIKVEGLIIFAGRVLNPSTS